MAAAAAPGDGISSGGANAAAAASGEGISSSSDSFKDTLKLTRRGGGAGGDAPELIDGPSLTSSFAMNGVAPSDGTRRDLGAFSVLTPIAGALSSSGLAPSRSGVVGIGELLPGALISIFTRLTISEEDDSSDGTGLILIGSCLVATGAGACDHDALAPEVEDPGVPEASGIGAFSASTFCAISAAFC